MGNLINAFQLNPDGDKKDYFHILNVGCIGPNTARVMNIWEQIPSEIDTKLPFILTGSSLTLGENIEPSILRERSEICAYNALAAVYEGTPVLAICYGAQILANELWPGSVQSTGVWNVGRKNMIVSQGNSILGATGTNYGISVSFKERLVGIPENHVIARSANNEILAYRFDSLIGILAHPEMPADIVQKLIEARKDDSRYPKVHIWEIQDKKGLSDPTDILINFFKQLEP